MPQHIQGGDIRVFIPITKIDTEKRIVYGTLALEVPDKAGEIMDYETAKEAVKAWSNAQSEASEGKSLGNVREMHSNIAAGKLIDIVFDDANKRIEGATKVVNDSSWQKVEEGVLTGYSLGGGYAKRWIDPENPQLKRYTPKISEFSLVDNPCMPGATFEVLKADGSIEHRHFKSTTTESAQEAQPIMKNSATPAANIEVPAPVQGWQAKDGSFHPKKQDALAKNASLMVEEASKPAADALKKMEETLAAKEGGEAEAPAAAEGDAPAGEQPAADASAAAAAAEASTEQPAADAAAAATESAPAGGADEAAPQAAEADPAPAEKVEGATLKKGLYEVSRMADLLQSICWLQCNVESEALMEKDGSPLPEALRSALKMLGEWLKAYVAEEVDELFPSADVDIEKAAEKGAPIEALAKFVGSEMKFKPGEELEKAMAFRDRLKKAAGKTMKAHLASMFDHHGTMQKSMDAMAKCMKSMGVGAEDGEEEEAQKSAGLSDEQLVKLAAFDGLQKKFDDQAAIIGKLVERLEKVEATPAETKGVVNTALVKKGHEAGAGAEPDEAAILAKHLNGAYSPEQTALALTKHSLRNPQIGVPSQS